MHKKKSTIMSGDDENNKNDINKYSDMESEDNALWAFVTRNIEPMHEQKRVVLDKEDDMVPTRLQNKRLPPEKPIKTQKQPQGREVDGRTAQRMQQGKLPIEARLDLHGMDQTQARQALESFLMQGYQQGRRLVLVITGKGKRGDRQKAQNWTDPHEPGILKKRTPDWLGEQPLRDIVLRYHFAKPQHGGDGALYILLRRKR